MRRQGGMCEEGAQRLALAGARRLAMAVAIVARVRAYTCHGSCAPAAVVTGELSNIVVLM